MKTFLRYIWAVLFVISSASFAQSFTTRVSSKAIGKSDLLEVQYVAENLELADFILPSFPGWVVQSGPNFSSNRMQSGNTITQQIIYSVTLQPTRTGKLSVPAATVNIDRNNKRKSNTVTIDVKPVDHVAGNRRTNMGSQPGAIMDDPAQDEETDTRDQVLRKGENPINKIKNNLLVKLDISKPTCYVGEAVIATYKLCTRLRSQSRVVKQPEFSGCTVTELTTEQTLPKREMINGKMYNVYVIRKVQLFPLQPGEVILPKASVANNVMFYKEEDLNYRDLFYNRSTPAFEQEVTVSNPPSVIKVKPLPMPQPDAFTGAVGRFTMEASVGDGKITTNNNAALSVVIEGIGNLQQIVAPTVTWPKGIEGFDPAQEEESDKNIAPVRVRKTFTYPFVVAKKGQYSLPGTGFCYFDPVNERYETIQTAALSFNVERGRKQVLPVSNIISTSDFQTRLYLLIIAAFVAVIAGLYWFNFKRSRKKQPVPAPVVPVKIETPPPAIIDSEQYIHAIRDLNPIEDYDFYKQLKRHISSYLGARYHVEGNDTAALVNAQPGEQETFKELDQLVRDCSLGMYTPVFDAEEAMKHRLRAIELLTKLEKARF
ncbi:protein BatD [Segetibacter sp. 3557_3]|uniref:BatD family protein n=1 Tax=Segetibacter sp. 3557_3 TaxID=2547429 RepID=UPI001058FD14|nr:BatD family protein [Segetibacter sp. 3557_3]TDH25128.1 protein BatD [Segetibacter sp. 3557_3]